MPHLLRKIFNFILLYSLLLFLSACGSGGDDSTVMSGDGNDAGNQSQDCGSVACKPLPLGVFESAGINDPVGNAVDTVALKGVLVRISWKVCGDDQACLFDTVQEQLDKATASNIKVSLMIMDGDEVPDGVKSRCTLFAFEKRGEPASMCLAWDDNYLADKIALIKALGQRFDSHPALAYVYFTGACSTNGAEGHCRIDEAAYTTAGYTPEKLTNAYLSIMDAYREAFLATPIAFEVHAIFNSANLWQDVWDHVSASGRVGVAAWWCSERLSVKGNDTVPVWSIVEAAAQSSFTVCQTVGNFSSQPYRFTDTGLGLDYGIEADWNQGDVDLAFQQTMDWMQGYAVHGGQTSMINRFSVAEIWTTDLSNPDLQARLLLF